MKGPQSRHWKHNDDEIQTKVDNRHAQILGDSIQTTALSNILIPQILHRMAEKDRAQQGSHPVARDGSHHNKDCVAKSSCTENREVQMQD